MVVVVEILTNKSTYNTLELTSGRMAKVGKGDIVVGALGHRKALFGYSGHVPESVKPGDIIQMLNIGGVLGIVRFGEPRQGQAVRLPRHRRRAALPVSRRAHRRAGARRLSPARLRRASSITQRRAGGRAGGHLHGGRQDRGRVPPSSRACAIAASSSTRSRRRAFRCAATSWRSKTPARATRSSSRTSASSRPRARWARRSRAPCSPSCAEKKPDVIVFELGDGLVGHLRRGFHPRAGRHPQGAAPAWCCRPTIRWRRRAASTSCASGSASSRSRSRARPPTTPWACTSSSDQLKVPAFNALAAGAALGDSHHRVRRPHAGAPARSRRQRDSR